MEGSTVQGFLDALAEMKAIYPFDDEKTILCTMNMMSSIHNHLSIRTLDEKTGIYIEMSKKIE